MLWLGCLSSFISPHWIDASTAFFLNETDTFSLTCIRMRWHVIHVHLFPIILIDTFINVILYYALALHDFVSLGPYLIVTDGKKNLNTNSTVCELIVTIYRQGRGCIQSVRIVSGSGISEFPAQKHIISSLMYVSLQHYLVTTSTIILWCSF